jgi:hypothetical protein
MYKKEGFRDRIIWKEVSPEFEKNIYKRKISSKNKY